MSNGPMTWHCVRCQQDYTLTAEYRITHICRQCRNGLVAVWAQVAKVRERFGVVPSKIFSPGGG